MQRNFKVYLFTVKIQLCAISLDGSKSIRELVFIVGKYGYVNFGPSKTQQSKLFSQLVNRLTTLIFSLTR